MMVFRFGVRVVAPPAEKSEGQNEPAGRGRLFREPLVVAPLVLGRFADAVVEGGPSAERALVRFDREAASLPAAIATAVLDLEHDGLRCQAVVPDDDLVTLGIIASRLAVAPFGLVGDGPPPGGAAGERPAPVFRCGGEWIFRWRDIAAWQPGVPEPTPEPVLASLNLALGLRRLVEGDPALAAAVRDLITA